MKQESFAFRREKFNVTITTPSGVEDWEDVALMAEHMEDWKSQAKTIREEVGVLSCS